MKKINGQRFPTVNEEGIYGFFQQYRWLSNYHMCEIHIQSIKYPSSEHAYVAMKTLHTRTRQRIRNFDTPAQAKAFGRTVKLRPDWESIKYDKMVTVLRCKFIQHKDLRLLLKGTRDLYLEETNDWSDTYWGVDYLTGRGENMLGKALMSIREELCS